MRKMLCMLLCMVVLAGQLWAQTRTITGRVTDAAGNPVANASVTVKGTSTGTTTNDDGTYTLTIPQDAKVLVISGIGYAESEQRIGSATTLNVTIDKEDKDLQEVVVVGYSTVSKRALTGSVAKVNGEQIANKPVLSFDQALTGKAAGVQINTSSGLVGDVVNIRVRGAASLNNSSQPLIIIDGVPVTQGNVGQLYNPVNALADLNPNDIESVEVLKDASAAAIYGSRASAGVILITTKKGRAGTAKINYDMYVGFNSPSRLMKVLNAEDYTSIINTMRSNASLSPVIDYGDYDGDGNKDVVNTDWQNEVYRTGFTQNHQVNMSGGTAKTNYYGSVSYTDFENYIINNRLRRGSARLNASTKATDWLTVGINTQYSRSYQYGLGSGTGAAASGIPLGPLRYYPNVPVKDPNGDFYLAQGGNALTVGILPNPVAVLLANFDNVENQRFVGSGYAEAQLIKGLKFRTQYNTDQQNGYTNQFWSPNVGDGSGLAGVAQKVFTQNKVWSWYNTLNYNANIGDRHTIGLLAGSEYTKTSSLFSYSYGIGLNDESLTLITPSNYGTVGAEDGFVEDGLASYFGGFNYSFDNKYILSGNLRADAYSGYGRDNRWGYFPSISAGWVVSQENFMANVNAISNLKLRASYGITGNSNIGAFASFASFVSANYAELAPALALSNPGNSALKWERTAQFDVGFDLSLWNKVNITADYYNKPTRDLVLANPILATVGFPGNVINQNIGQLESRGVELGIQSTNISKRDFTWTTNFNIAYNKNRVISTNSNNDDIFGGAGIARPGEELGSYFLIRWAGVNPDNGLPQFLDIDGNVKAYNHAAPAAERWTDDRGNVTTAITAADRVVQTGKTPYPKFFGGLLNTVQYKSFDLSVDLQYAFGYYLFNQTLQGLASYTNVNNKTEFLKDAWTAPGQQTDVPKLYWGDNQWSQTSTRWLEKGDFLRIRNLQIGYSIPKAVTDRFKLSRLRVYAQGQNLFTFTGYKGIDPEANSNGNTNIGLGVDNNRPYLARTITFGLNLGL
jgi:TonB-linked SusC/RagA family outer membrane protein